MSLVSDYRSVDRVSKIKENEEKMKTLQLEKLEKSNAMFKDTKVATCSQVLVKNG